MNNRSDLRDRTTDLARVRKNPKCFTWGHVFSIIDVGFYTFIHFTENGDDNFFIYVKGESTGTSSASLEGAMLLAIAYRNGKSDADMHMARAAGKLLGIKEV